jgi:hypothetical protein
LLRQSLTLAEIGGFSLVKVKQCWSLKQEIKSTKSGLPSFAHFWWNGLNVTKMDSRYDRIDMDYVEKIRIFSKSLGKYVPRFAIYKLSESKLRMIINCQCDHHHSKDVYETNVYPSELNQDNYSDIMGETLLTRICKSYFSEENEVIKYTHEFKGLFPDEVRKIIKECGFQLDQLFLIEESYAWNCTVERINPDPIIVGLYQNYFYYICSFDITSMEQFVLTEKTTHV